MTLYLLDTNICIAYLNNSNVNVVYQLKNISPNDVYLCQIVKAELMYGACKSKSTRQAENIARAERFFRQFKSLPFDNKSVATYGRIRANLNKIGKPIGPNDLIIASIAVAHDVTLVTHNIREFSRIPQLKYVDWMK
ncbi:MAG: type II toxin-antitoxin system VapC family toxin [Chloroflexota bacterium]